MLWPILIVLYAALSPVLEVDGKRRSTHIYTQPCDSKQKDVEFNETKFIRNGLDTLYMILSDIKSSSKASKRDKETTTLCRNSTLGRKTEKNVGFRQAMKYLKKPVKSSSTALLRDIQSVLCRYYHISTKISNQLRELESPYSKKENEVQTNLLHSLCVFKQAGIFQSDNTCKVYVELLEVTKDNVCTKLASFKQEIGSYIRKSVKKIKRIRGGRRRKGRKGKRRGKKSRKGRKRNNAPKRKKNGSSSGEKKGTVVKNSNRSRTKNRAARQRSNN